MGTFYYGFLDLPMFVEMNDLGFLDGTLLLSFLNEATESNCKKCKEENRTE
jgi:hypothetical protein